MRIQSLSEFARFKEGQRFDNATVIVLKNCTLIKMENGAIFTLHHSTHLYDGWNMNDFIRRAWCRLSGVKFVDLKKAIAAHKAEQESERVKGKVEDLRRMAGKLGYDLRKRH
jgi:hypothetical protein